MTTTDALRKQVKKYVEKADEKSLRIVHAILEIEEGHDFWDELPSYFITEALLLFTMSL